MLILSTSRAINSCIPLKASQYYIIFPAIKFQNEDEEIPANPNASFSFFLTVKFKKYNIFKVRSFNNRSHLSHIHENDEALTCLIQKTDFLKLINNS